MLAYDNDKLETATLVAGRCDAGLRGPAAPLPELNEGGPRGDVARPGRRRPGSPGDVHVAVTGLPASSSIVGGVLTDAVRGTWIYRANDRVAIPDEPSALPLVIKPRSDGKAADLFFAPYRDESKETMTLRLIAADGRNLLVRFPGQSCDLARMAPRPEPSRIEARPGDDLQALVESTGRSCSRAGTYRLSRPLVLNRPVTVTSDGGRPFCSTRRATEPPGRRPSRFTVAIPRSMGSRSGSRARSGGTTRFRGGRP